MKLVVWSVREDQQGECYHHGITRQTFNNRQPELLELFQCSEDGTPIVAPDAPAFQISVA